MASIGYARCSHETQDTSIQIERLKAAGCSVVRAEKVSGKSLDGRDELATIMAFLQRGDEIVVCRLDRLGRSTRDVLNLVHEVEAKGASLRILEPAIDTSGPMGKVVLTTLSMVAEMELSFIKSRQAAGIAKAKAAKVYKGRKPSLDHAKIREMRAAGIGATDIAKAVGCTRASVYLSLQKSLS